MEAFTSNDLCRHPRVGKAVNGGAHASEGCLIAPAHLNRWGGSFENGRDPRTLPSDQYLEYLQKKEEEKNKSRDVSSVSRRPVAAAAAAAAEEEEYDDDDDDDEDVDDIDDGPAPAPAPGVKEEPYPVPLPRADGKYLDRELEHIAADAFADEKEKELGRLTPGSIDYLNAAGRYATYERFLLTLLKGFQGILSSQNYNVREVLPDFAKQLEKSISRMDLDSSSVLSQVVKSGIANAKTTEELLNLLASNMRLFMDKKMSSLISNIDIEFTEKERKTISNAIANRIFKTMGFVLDSEDFKNMFDRSTDAGKERFDTLSNVFATSFDRLVTNALTGMKLGQKEFLAAMNDDAMKNEIKGRMLDTIQTIIKKAGLDASGEKLSSAALALVKKSLGEAIMNIVSKTDPTIQSEKLAEALAEKFKNSKEITQALQKSLGERIQSELNTLKKVEGLSLNEETMKKAIAKALKDDTNIDDAVDTAISAVVQKHLDKPLLSLTVKQKKLEKALDDALVVNNDIIKKALKDSLSHIVQSDLESEELSNIFYALDYEKMTKSMTAAIKEHLTNALSENGVFGSIDDVVQTYLQNLIDHLGQAIRWKDLSFTKVRPILKTSFETKVKSGIDTKELMKDIPEILTKALQGDIDDLDRQFKEAAADATGKTKAPVLVNTLNLKALEGPVKTQVTSAVRNSKDIQDNLIAGLEQGLMGLVHDVANDPKKQVDYAKIIGDYFNYLFYTKERVDVGSEQWDPVTQKYVQPQEERIIMKPSVKEALSAQLRKIADDFLTSMNPDSMGFSEADVKTRDDMAAAVIARYFPEAKDNEALKAAMDRYANTVIQKYIVQETTVKGKPNKVYAAANQVINNAIQKIFTLVGEKINDVSSAMVDQDQPEVIKMAASVKKGAYEEIVKLIKNVIEKETTDFNEQVKNALTPEFANNIKLIGEAVKNVDAYVKAVTGVIPEKSLISSYTDALKALLRFLQQKPMEVDSSSSSSAAASTETGIQIGGLKSLGEEFAGIKNSLDALVAEIRSSDDGEEDLQTAAAAAAGAATAIQEDPTNPFAKRADVTQLTDLVNSVYKLIKGNDRPMLPKGDLFSKLNTNHEAILLLLNSILDNTKSFPADSMNKKYFSDIFSKLNVITETVEKLSNDSSTYTQMETRLNAKIAALEKANADAQDGLVKTVNATIRSNFDNLRAEIKTWMNTVGTTAVPQVTQVRPDSTYFDEQILAVNETLKEVALQLQKLNRIEAFFPILPKGEKRSVITYNDGDMKLYNNAIASIATYLPSIGVNLESLESDSVLNPLTINRAAQILIEMDPQGRYLDKENDDFSSQLMGREEIIRRYPLKPTFSAFAYDKMLEKPKQDLLEKTFNHFILNLTTNYPHLSNNPILQSWIGDKENIQKLIHDLLRLHLNKQQAATVIDDFLEAKASGLDKNYYLDPFKNALLNALYPPD